MPPLEASLGGNTISKDSIASVMGSSASGTDAGGGGGLLSKRSNSCPKA